MPNVSPWPAYIMGTSMLGIGLLSLASPTRAYELTVTPASRRSLSPGDASTETVSEKRHPAAQGTASGNPPLLFVAAKAARDVGIGLTFLGLQAQGFDDAVTTLGAATAVVGVLDGWVVWQFGGEDLRPKAFGYVMPALILSGWAGWRAFYAK